MTSPSSTAERTGRARAAATTSGTRAVMSSRVRVNTATSPPSRCDLDPGAVQLPLDRGLPHPLHGRLDAGRGRGQHRLEGAADLEVELAQGRDAGGQGGLGHRAEGPAQHHGPPHLGPGDPGGLGDGLDHHPLQGALAELARQQADQEALLGGGRPPEQLANQPPPLGLRPGPGQPADPLEGGVDLGHGQGGPGRRVGGVAQGRPADPDLALAQVAGEERHRRVDLARLQAPQARRQPLHLGQAGGAGGDGGGRPGDLVEQHRAILPDRRDNRYRRWPAGRRSGRLPA